MPSAAATTINSDFLLIDASPSPLWLAPSERQRARPRDRVDLDQCRVLLVTTAVGSAARDPRPADRADEGAGRTGELPGAAVDRGHLRHLERGGAGPPIDGE